MSIPMIKSLIVNDCNVTFNRSSGHLDVQANGPKRTVSVSHLDGEVPTLLLSSVECEGNLGGAPPTVRIRDQVFQLESIHVMAAGSLTFDGNASNAVRWFKAAERVTFKASDDSIIKGLTPVGSSMNLVAEHCALIQCHKLVHQRLNLEVTDTGHICGVRATVVLNTHCSANGRILASYGDVCLWAHEGSPSEVRAYVSPSERKEALLRHREEKTDRQREKVIRRKSETAEFLEELDEEIEDEERARKYGALPLEEEIIDDHVMDANDVRDLMDEEKPNPDRIIMDRLADYVQLLRNLASIKGYMRVHSLISFTMANSVLIARLNARQTQVLTEHVTRVENDVRSIAPFPSSCIPPACRQEADPRDQCQICCDFLGDRVLNCAHDRICEGCIDNLVMQSNPKTGPLCPLCRALITSMKVMERFELDD